ncbi:MAG: recombinase family protein [Bacteroidaceae bacterium]
MLEELTQKITIIEPTKNLHFNMNDGTINKLRVCAYARVSTDLEDQKNSYDAQLDEFGNRIKKNPKWEFVKLYADQGVSGTSIKHRKGFKQMIDDAMNGKIDLILTKSISRFARNTVDCLSIVRQLRKRNVFIYFEKENITSNDEKADFVLTLFASFAQEESKSISENVKWGIRKRMNSGVVHFSKTLLGFNVDKNGIVTINQEEAKIVKAIYNLYLSGCSYRDICSFLEQKEYKTPTGKTKWSISTINSILENEKYCGDVTLQKTYVEDFLTHRSKKNTGQLASILIENHHEPIITKEVFLYVQSIIGASKLKRNAHKLHYKPLAGTVFCGNCKRPMKKVTYHSNKSYSKNVLSCKKTSVKSENYQKCSLMPVDYDTLINIATRVILDNYKGNLYYKEIAKYHMIKTSTYYNEFYANSINIKTKIAKLEKQIKIVIKKKINETTNNGTLEIQFNKLKQELAKNRKKLEQLNQAEFDKNTNCNFLNEINKFIDDSSFISYTIINKFIGKIIRKRDNTFRVILNNCQLEDKYVIDNFDTLMHIPVQYSKDNYEVCELGGYSHE